MAISIKSKSEKLNELEKRIWALKDNNSVNLKSFGDDCTIDVSGNPNHKFVPYADFMGKQVKYCLNEQERLLTLIKEDTKEMENYTEELQERNQELLKEHRDV